MSEYVTDSTQLKSDCVYYCDNDYGGFTYVTRVKPDGSFYWTDYHETKESAIKAKAFECGRHTPGGGKWRVYEELKPKEPEKSMWDI